MGAFMDPFAMKMINEANEQIQANPKDSRAYNQRGQAYGILGHYQQSVEDFTVSITLSPNVGAYINRGFEHYQAGERGKAIDDFRMAVKLDPNDQGNRFLQQALAGVDQLT